MAERVGWLVSEAEAIRANADTLERVEQNVHELEALTRRQARDILDLRATVMGLCALLQRKLPFDDGELAQEVSLARGELIAPPGSHPTDPYRGGRLDPAEDSEEAQQLIQVARDHHFAMRFDQARAAYQEVVDRFGGSRQAQQARQQLATLDGY